MTTLQIFGPSDSAFRRLAENAELAARILGIEYRVQRIPDPMAAQRLGVKRAPVLLVDGEAKVSGWVPLPEEIMALLSSPSVPCATCRACVRKQMRDVG